MRRPKKCGRYLCCRSGFDKEKAMRALFLIAFVVALTVLPTSLSAQPRLIEYNADRWIEVSGEGSVRATPDFARVTLGVTTTGKDAREAMAANAKSANALVALIKSEGVSPADIQTSGM